MGYLTYFTLNKITGSDEDFDALVEDIKEKTGIDFAKDNCEEAKWYDCEKDMLALSRKYPDLTVQLDGDGENSDDLWAERFRNGECESVGIEMPPFVYFTTDDERKRYLEKIVPGARKDLIRLIDAILSDREDGQAETGLTLRESELTVTTAVKVARSEDGIDVWLSQHYRDENASEGTPVDGENLSVNELNAIACALLNVRSH